AAALTAYQESYDAWQQARATLASLQGDTSERLRRAEMLRTALAEIEAVDPQEGEEDALAAEEERLAHVDGLLRGAEEAHALISGTDETVEDQRPVVELLGAAAQALAQVSEHDPELAELAGRVQELGYLASDLGADLASYAAGLDVDPQRLAEVQQRRATVTGLLRRYGQSSAEVLAWARQAAAELVELDVSDERIATLTEEVTRLEQETLARGAELGRLRQAAAEQLQERVGEELAHLAMGNARVVV